MKFRKMVKYGLVLFFFAIAVYFVFCLVTNYRPEDALPPEPQAVLNIHRPKKLIYEYEFVFSEYPEFSRLKKFLPLIPDFRMTLCKLAFGPVLIVDMGYYRGASFLAFQFKDRFLKPKEDGFYIEENPVLSRQDPDTYVLRHGRETLGFISKKKNLLIISPFLKAVQMAISHLSMTEKPGELDLGGDVSFFFQTGKLLGDLVKIYPQLEFLKSALSKNSTGILRMDFKPDRISMDLKLSLGAAEDSKEKILAQILSLEPGERKMPQSVPLRVGSFISLSLADYQRLSQLIMEYFKEDPAVLDKLQTGFRALQYLSKKKPVEEILFQWMDTEMGAVSLSDTSEPLFLIRIRDLEQFREGFGAFIGAKQEEVQGHSVYSVELPGIYQFLKSLFVPSVQLPFFTLYENRYLVFANSVKELDAFLRLSSVRLPVSPGFTAISENWDSQAQIAFFADLSYGMVPLSKISPLFAKLMQRYRQLGASVRLNYPEIRIKLNLAKE